jgi:hypothetical protein
MQKVVDLYHGLSPFVSKSPGCCTLSDSDNFSPNPQRETEHGLEDSHTHSPQKPWRTVQDAMPVSDFVPLLHWNANIHPSPSAANPIYVYDIYDRH